MGSLCSGKNDALTLPNAAFSCAQSKTNECPNGCEYDQINVGICVGNWLSLLIYTNVMWSKKIDYYYIALEIDMEWE